MSALRVRLGQGRLSGVQAMRLAVHPVKKLVRLFLMPLKGALRYLFPGPGEPITVPYTVFKEEAARQNIAQIYSRGTSIEGRFVTAVTFT